MEMKSTEQTALSHIASRWWGGPDPGRQVTVDIRVSVPTTRTDQEVVELFGEFMKALAGGYRWRVSIPKD